MKTVSPALSLIAFGALTMLAACGGGGSTPSASFSGATISGTAAIGAALSGATVEVKCATGTGSANTASDGTYTVKIEGGALPCMLRATSADKATVLYSVADGSGAQSVTANVTPLTELIIAKAIGTGATAADTFASYKAETKDVLSAGKLANAKSEVAGALKSVVDLSGFDPLTTAFKAKTANAEGDATDKKIDTVMERLTASQTTLDALANAIVTAPASTSSSTSTVVNILTPPPVSGCAAARNVPYVIVGMGGDHGLSQATDFKADGGSVSVAWSNGRTETSKVSFDDTKACQFTVTNSSGTLTGVFASSGIFVVRELVSADSSGGIGIGIPLQTVALADLAGKWNVLGYSDDESTGMWSNYQSVATLDAYGKATTTDCSGTTKSTDVCTQEGGLPVFSVNSDGGFDVTDSNGGKARAFGFRSTTGKLMLVVSRPGGIMIASKQASLTAQPVNSVSKFWDIQASLAGTSTTGYFQKTTFDWVQTTVKSVNAADNSVTRTRDTLNGVADGRVDTVFLNQPRAGLRYRAAGTYVLNGVTKSFGEAIQMPLGDLKLTVTTGTGGLNSGKYLDLSVIQ